MRTYLRFVLTLSLLLGLTVSLYAQTEPDTVRQKPSLPTTPTPAPQQQQRQPQPRVQERPPVPEQPQVVKPEAKKAEAKEKLPLIDRLYWGGGLGLQFGTYTAISLSPIVGVKATEKFWTGGGVVYQYRGAGGVNLQTIGGKAFAQLEVFNNFVLHGEYELLSVEYEDGRFGNNLVKERDVVGVPLAGLGYRQHITDRVSSDILVLYNFNDELANPYSNPVIRVNFNFPFRR